jgi:uncharacterized Tic20 family protein
VTPYLCKEERQRREALHETISIILIILVLVTAIVLTCELESAGPAFIIAIAFFLIASRR